MFETFKAIAVRGRCSMKKGAGAAIAAVTALTAGIGAHAQITLPDPGVDLAGHVDAAVLGLGSVVLAVAGGYFAYLIIRKGFRWGNRFG